VLASDYPLSQLDGLNSWYEDRLADENIDDMQNLATANSVDIILHTRVPVGRLVDWVDQAFLFLHLDRVERRLLENRRARKLTQPGSRGDTLPNPVSHHARPVAGSSIGPASRSGTRTRTQLRQLGIRTATDLIKAFPPDEIDPDADSSQNPAPGTDLGKTLEDADMCHSQIRNLVRVRSEEQGLAAVWNWHDRGVRARCPHRQLRSTRSWAAPQPFCTPSRTDRQSRFRSQTPHPVRAGTSRYALTAAWTLATSNLHSTSSRRRRRVVPAPSATGKADGEELRSSG